MGLIAKYDTFQVKVRDRVSVTATMAAKTETAKMTRQPVLWSHSKRDAHIGPIVFWRLLTTFVSFFSLSRTYSWVQFP